MPYLKLPVINDETCIDDKFLNHMQDGIANAYFTTDNTLTLSGGKLLVNTVGKANDSTADNSLPITAAAVNVVLGNIDALLETV